MANKERYKELLLQLVNECDNVRWLRCATVFMAELNDKVLIENAGNCSITEKGGTANG